jgi:hypothetical protein
LVALLPNKSFRSGLPKGTQVRRHANRFKEVCLSLTIWPDEKNPIRPEDQVRRLNVAKVFQVEIQEAQDKPSGGDNG